MLTHRNFLSEVRGILTAAIGQAVAKPGNRILTFLPLAHVLARAVSLAVFEGGAAQAHWAEFGTVSGQFTRYSPHMILGVPRVFEKVRDAAAGKAAAGGKLNAAIFQFAEETAIAYSESLDHGGPSLFLKAKRTMADRLVYGKLREAMGGECQMAISGGGALSIKLGHFFRGVGVPIYEGYGLTESTAAHTVNMPGSQKIGTVDCPWAATVFVSPRTARSNCAAGSSSTVTGATRRPPPTHSTTVGSAPATSVRSTPTDTPPSPDARRTSSSPPAARTSLRALSKTGCVLTPSCHRLSSSATDARSSRLC